MILLRSLLFVPGNKTSMLEKALALTPGPAAPDAYVPDMEDSVPAAEKANARATIAGFVARLATTGKPVIPRVNALDSGLFEEDVTAVVGPAISGHGLIVSAPARFLRYAPIAAQWPRAAAKT